MVSIVAAEYLSQLREFENSEIEPVIAGRPETDSEFTDPISGLRRTRHR